MTSNDRIRVLIQKRGYIVLASTREHPIGEILLKVSGIEGGKTEQPLAITKETDGNDAVEQDKILTSLGEYTGGVGDWEYFYRLSTD